MTISIQQAWEILMGLDLLTRPEGISIFNARGRISSKTIKANYDSPPFEQSRYDGFAIGEKLEGRDFFVIIDKNPITAGDPGRRVLKNGGAIPIMTGAPIPTGTKWVVPQERCHIRDGKLLLRDPPQVGRMILGKGSNFTKGNILLHEGEEITPIHVAFLALDGRDYLDAYSLPRVGVLSFGNELAPVPTVHLGDAIIRNSHPALIQALVSPLGVVEIHGHARDNHNEIKHRLKELWDTDCQVFVTTGGLGRGVKDLTREAVRAVGATPLFEGVNAFPIGTFSCYQWGKKVIFSLPGGMLAVLLLTKLFISPFLMKIQGNHVPETIGPFPKAFLETQLSKHTSTHRGKIITFIKSHLWYKDETLRVKPLENRSLLSLNSFMVLNMEETKGREIPVFPLWDR